MRFYTPYCVCSSSYEREIVSETRGEALRGKVLSHSRKNSNFYIE